MNRLGDLSPRSFNALLQQVLGEEQGQQLAVPAMMGGTINTGALQQQQQQSNQQPGQAQLGSMWNWM